MFKSFQPTQVLFGRFCWAKAYYETVSTISLCRLADVPDHELHLDGKRPTLLLGMLEPKLDLPSAGHSCWQALLAGRLPGFRTSQIGLQLLLKKLQSRDMELRQGINELREFFLRFRDSLESEIRQLMTPSSTRTRLMRLEEAADFIETGAPCVIAGPSEALRRLPTGNWIGGSTPSFITRRESGDAGPHVLLTVLPEATRFSLGWCGPDELDRLAQEAPEHGFSFLIVPFDSEVHRRFAIGGREIEGLFLRPVIGWVAGVPELAEGVSPICVLGSTGEVTSVAVVFFHMELPPSKTATIRAINVYKPSNGPVYRFPKAGFSVRECWVNGEQALLADHARKHDGALKLPLIGDFAGASVNVSIRQINEDGTVDLFAPVFPEVDYRFAKPLDSFSGRLVTELSQRRSSGECSFSCNCVLNRIDGPLPDEILAEIEGPVTFGEIAYQLLNQTIVQLRVV